MTAPHIPVVQLAHAEGLPLPAYETNGAAGMTRITTASSQRM